MSCSSIHVADYDIISMMSTAIWTSWPQCSVTLQHYTGTWCHSQCWNHPWRKHHDVDITATMQYCIVAFYRTYNCPNPTKRQFIMWHSPPVISECPRFVTHSFNTYALQFYFALPIYQTLNSFYDKYSKFLIPLQYYKRITNVIETTTKRLTKVMNVKSSSGNGDGESYN